MEDLKKKVEALLFSSARRMNLEEIAKLTRHSTQDINEVLLQLKNDYAEKGSSLMVVGEGDYWKLTTKEEYLGLVKKIVTQTELSKTLMETLAVIAFKYPIKQADLIKIRTNKAYDHLKELEEMGYVTRQKYGRTKLIKLSQRFFDYFSLPEEKLKEQFSDFEGLAHAIEEKEGEIKKINEEQKKKAKEAGKKEVDLIDEKGNKVKLDVVDVAAQAEIKPEEKAKLETYDDTVGKLEVVDVPAEQPKQEIPEESKEAQPEEEQTQEEIKIEQELEEKVDERVHEILGVPENFKKEEESEEEKNVSDSAVDRRVEELFDPNKEDDSETAVEENKTDDNNPNMAESSVEFQEDEYSEEPKDQLSSTEEQNEESKEPEEENKDTL